MAATVSLQGIDEAILNLNYRNPQALKSKLVHSIRAFYEDVNAVESQGKIDAEALIKALWDTGNDPAAVKAKRKNLSSTKSSVNSDLKKLFKAGKNPDGVIIGRDNVFVMSDEAKDKLLSSFGADGTGGQAVLLEEIAHSLNAIREVLSHGQALEDHDSPQASIILDDLRSTIQQLSERIGTGDTEATVSQSEEVAAKPTGDGKSIEETEGANHVVQEVQEPEAVDLEDAQEPVDAVVADDALEEGDPEEDGQPAGDVEASEELDADVVDEILEEDALAEDIEAVDGDDLEEVLEAVDAEQTAPEVALENAEEVGLPSGSLGEEPVDAVGDTEKSRRLAEVFDGYLGTMERFYNQYLLIPAGQYKVGSKAPKRDERPEQIVRLTSFYMGTFPVTNALFEVFVEKTGYVTAAEKAGYGTVYYGRLCKEVDDKSGAVRFRCNGTVGSKTVEGAFWYQPCGPGSTLHLKRNHPVVQVSLKDAMAFAAWTGKRLPSEDEWEAAARTEKGYAYPWGNIWQGDACNLEDSAIADTTPVDAFKERANGLAIVDTLGNVLEWTSDVFPPSQNTANSHEYYVVKGGSWVSENDVSLWSRFKVKGNAPSNILGFRCVAS